MLDLDGVVWLADTPIPGAAGACRALVEAGADVAFVTNMSRLRVGEQEAKLARHGIDGRGRVVTSAMAAAACCQPGERALVVGGPGILEALAGRGVEVVESGPADVVVVGMDPGVCYDDLERASLAVRDGARLLATNTDPTYPTPRGLVPGAGAIVAAVEVASGQRATVAGKPHPPVVGLIQERLGNAGVVVGDRADTDGALAVALGYRFALVLSGVTGADDLPVDPPADRVAPDLARLVDEVLA